MGIVLQTDRLVIRRLLLSDLDSLFALYRDPDICRHIPDAPRTIAEARVELEWHMNGHPQHPELGLWATIDKDTGNFIGRCGLLPWTFDGQAEVEVAYALAKGYWGRGLATEAAQAIRDHAVGALGLARLICLIDPDNQASIRVAEKIGMAFEREGRDTIGPFHLYSQGRSAQHL